MSAIKFPELPTVHCRNDAPGNDDLSVIKSTSRGVTFGSGRSSIRITPEGLGDRPGHLIRILDTPELKRFADKARRCAAAGGLTEPQVTALRDLGAKLDVISGTWPRLPSRN